MSTGSINLLLAELGERVFNGSPVRAVKPRRGLTGLRLLGRPAASGDLGAEAVRRKLHGIIRRTPQVVVRISGGGKTIGHIKAHLDYISRKGRLELEDQNGDRSKGKEGLNMLRDEWAIGGFPVLEEGRRREAFNIILSMPAGTNERALYDAARAFAASEFEDCQYVMALHCADTDPHPDPASNPHVHLCVKATRLDGTRLNPRKADLQRWRDNFAGHLRARGIEAESTTRLHRLQRVRGEKQNVRHKKARGEAFERLGNAPDMAARRLGARVAQAQLLRGYQGIANLLAASTSPEDRALAIGLIGRLGDQQKSREDARELHAMVRRPGPDRGDKT